MHELSKSRKTDAHRVMAMLVLLSVYMDDKWMTTMWNKLRRCLFAKQRIYQLTVQT